VDVKPGGCASSCRLHPDRLLACSAGNDLDSRHHEISFEKEVVMNRSLLVTYVLLLGESFHFTTYLDGLEGSSPCSARSSRVARFAYLAGLIFDP
jgi:hypothetical protein